MDKRTGSKPLKDCPFCGEKDRVKFATGYRETLGQVKCFNCGARVGNGLQTEEEAYKKWNTRKEHVLSKDCWCNPTVEDNSK